MKIISYSLYGNITKYTQGMIKNIKINKNLYPDWINYIYYNTTVPDDIIVELSNFDNVKMIDMSHMKIPGMFWRFLPNDDKDIECFIVRDSDSRVTEREVMAVNEWLNSNKKLHIMRDHPHHNYVILGGMWGIKCDDSFNMMDEISKYNKSTDLYEKMTDMNFLRDVVYSKFRNNSFVHDSFFNYEKWSKKFPIDLDDYKFVGEIYNDDDSREYQYTLLKNKK